MKKIILIFLILIALLSLVGCQEKKPTAVISTALLRNSEINSGDTTDLIVDARNSGEVPADIRFNITTESPDKVKLTFQSPLEFTLQPGETMGNKIIKVNGITETISTSYLITVALTDPQGKLFDNKNMILKVNKLQ